MHSISRRSIQRPAKRSTRPSPSASGITCDWCCRRKNASTIINGVKYFDYVLGSDDFKARVAKSKFAQMKNFAKFDTGYVALQGDHGQIAFRNIKILPLESKR